MPGTLIADLVRASDNISISDSWITPLGQALDGLDAAGAAWKPSSDERSIWEIVQHLTSWTDWVVSWLSGIDSEVIDWPPVAATDEASWEAACERLDASLTAFRDRINLLNPDSLLVLPTPEITETNSHLGILSILIHNAHHAGQVVKLRAELERGR
jgi:hypothetical protein